MDIISSMLSVLKNVGETDREFKLLKEKLVFYIRKAETALKKYQKERHVHSFIKENLENRLNYAREKLVNLQTLIPSQEQGSISFKDKIKLSLPFNNERDKINEITEDLRQAVEQFLNNNLPTDPTGVSSIKKKAHQLQQEEHLDNQIDELYEMGPTIQQNNALDFAQEYTKNHTVELKIEIGGKQVIVNNIGKNNQIIIVEHTCERTSKEELIELYKLGRLNFKKQYKLIKPLYPDIDKISKEMHFRVMWKRPVPKSIIKNENHPQQKPEINKKSVTFDTGSQKKEEMDQFFSVPEVEHLQFENGTLVVEKQKKILYRRVGGSWLRIEEEMFEPVNGQEVAICLNDKDQMPEIHFKISYRWK